MTEREAAEHMAFTIERAVAKWLDGKLTMHDHHDLQMAAAQYRVVRSVLDTLERKEAEVWPELAPSTPKYTGRQCEACSGSGLHEGSPNLNSWTCDLCAGTGRKS